MNKIYCVIGPLIYEIHTQDSYRIEGNVAQYFFTSLDGIDTSVYTIIRCDVSVVDEIQAPDGKVLYQNGERAILTKDGHEIRIHVFQQSIYGMYEEVGEHAIHVTVTHDLYPKQIVFHTLFLELIALEKHLLERNALVLHSSFIAYNGEGIVFSAPSSTGKSTQASLWEKYRGAEVVNGDRSIIWIHDDEILVCGLPFCGSSGINYLIEFPLRSIVFLSQSPVNEAEVSDTAFAVRKLFTEMSINQWNGIAVNKAFDCIETIVSKIKCMKYACNMEEDAVDTLEKEIYR